MLWLLPLLLSLPVRSASQSGTAGEHREPTLRIGEDLPTRPRLSPEDREEVARWTTVRREAERLFLESGDSTDLGEALRVARAELALRLRAQAREPEGGEWWEVIDARQRVADLQRMEGWGSSERQAARELSDLEAEVVEAFGANDYPAMLAKADAVVSLRERLWGTDSPTLAAALENRALAQVQLGRSPEGMADFEAALAIHIASRGHRHPAALDVERRIAAELHDMGRTREARDRLERLLPPLRDVLGDEDKRSLRALHLYAQVLARSGEDARAAEVYRHVARVARDAFGAGEFVLHTAQKSLAEVLARLGELDEAEAVLRELVRTLEDLGPAEVHDALVVRGALHDFLRNHRGRESAPLEASAELAADAALALGEDHPQALALGVVHAQSLLSAGRPTEALPYLRRAVAAGPRMASAVDGAMLHRMRVDLARALKRSGRPDEAEGLARAILADCRAERGPSDSTTLEALDQLASVLHAMGRIDEAVRHRRSAWELSVEALGAGHRYSLFRHRSLASDLAQLGLLLQRDGEPAAAAFEEAIELAREAARLAEEHLGPDHPGTLDARRTLANCLVRGRRFEESAELASQLVQEAIRIHGPDDITTKRLRGELATSWMLLGQYTRARDAIEGLEEEWEQLPFERRFLEILTGEIAYRQGDLDEALLAYQTARTLATAQRRATQADLAARSGADERSQSHSIGTTLAAIHARRGDPIHAWEALEATLGQPMLELLQSDGRDAPQRPAEAQIEALHAGLGSDEHLVAVLWSSARIVVASLDGKAPFEEAARASVVAEGFEEVLDLASRAARIAGWLRAPSPGSRPSLDATRLVEGLFDEELRSGLGSARRIVCVPDGPLATIPLAALAELTDGALGAAPVAYSSSGSLYLDRRETRSEPSGKRLLALGDPLFDPAGPSTPEAPEHGVVLTQIVAGGAAQKAGMEPGDVLLAYAGRALGGPMDLLHARNAFAAEAHEGEARVRVWREGRTFETAIDAGSMGVLVDRTHAPPDGLRRLRGTQLPVEERNRLAAQQARSNRMGPLPPLPGTRVEVREIAALASRARVPSRVLLGSQATREELERSLNDVGWLHLATHGRAGSREHPYDAGLALTPSEGAGGTASVLTLERLLDEWTTELEGCELVVLSACETQRGARRGASSLALPWGFFRAGASTVVASLWKVDDRATSLLMRRFYANLLAPPGERLGKLEALAEAQDWLRRLSFDEAEDLAGVDPPGDRAAADRGLGLSPSADRAGAARPFEHPYFWAGFVLLGDPE